ncbi:hypothetical protein HK103_002456 [Boothiomyces macroporosus]|uniref:Uncharacterized protein n=1 Tax=Boothiomyces macroporosus TaxID=261099 RepID=A0AAD5U9N9_9FUNG|nr:hypothetical protein HK103_002456 [Boothiomyces macroporosus]
MEQIRKRPRIELTDLNQQEIKDIESIRDILLQEGVNDDLLSFDTSNQAEKPVITYPNNGNNLFNEHQNEVELDDYEDFNIDEQTWNELQEQATQKLKEMDQELKFNASNVNTVPQNTAAYITPTPTFKPPPVMNSQLIFPLASQREDPKIKELESALLEKQGEITFARNKILKLTELNNELIKKTSVKEDSAHKNEIERLKMELEFMKQEIKTLREKRIQPRREKMEPLASQSQNIPSFVPKSKFTQPKKLLDDFDMNMYRAKSMKKIEPVQDQLDLMDVDIIPAEPSSYIKQSQVEKEVETKSVETNTFKMIEINMEKELVLVLSQYLSFTELDAFFCSDIAEFLNQHQYIVEIAMILIEFQDYKLPSDLIPQLYNSKSTQLYRLLVLLIQDGNEIDVTKLEPDYNNPEYIRLLHLAVVTRNIPIDLQSLDNIALTHELIGLYCTLRQCKRVYQVIDYYKETKDSTVFYLLHVIYHEKEILDFKEFCMVKVFLEEYDTEKQWPIFE